MVTIIKGEDRRKVTKGAFDTYFKGIGYEIEKRKVTKPVEKIDNTEDKHNAEQDNKNSAQRDADNKNIGKNKKQED